MVLHDLHYGCLDLTLKPWIFFKTICEFHSSRVFDPCFLPLKWFLLTHTCKSKDENWTMFDQLDLKGIPKIAKDMRRKLSIFMVFLWKNINVKKMYSKKIFHVWMFWNEGLYVFEVDVQHGCFLKFWHFYFWKSWFC
jgi:hypothetical protein